MHRCNFKSTDTKCGESRRFKILLCASDLMIRIPTNRLVLHSLYFRVSAPAHLFTFIILMSVSSKFFLIISEWRECLKHYLTHDLLFIKLSYTPLYKRTRRARTKFHPYLRIPVRGFSTKMASPIHLRTIILPPLPQYWWTIFGTII